MRIKLIKYVIMALVIIAGIIWYTVVSKGSSSRGLSIEMESTISVEAVTDDSGGDHAALADDMEGTNDETTAVVAVVYVCGAVLCPGVYELPKDARVITAIEAAGGFSAEAAVDYLNLARVVSDGEKLQVPTLEEVAAGLVGIIGETAAGSTTLEKTLSVNINTATREELMELPGIGESRALSIIAYREENGAFDSIEEIMLVSGIKEGAFAKIKAYIRVSP